MASLDLSNISTLSSVSERRTEFNYYERTNGYIFSSGVRNFILRDKRTTRGSSKSSRKKS